MARKSHIPSRAACSCWRWLGKWWATWTAWAWASVAMRRSVVGEGGVPGGARHSFPSGPATTSAPV